MQEHQVRLQWYVVQHLPAGHQIALKLTVDTERGIDTSLTLGVDSAEGESTHAQKSSCRSRDSDIAAIQEEIGPLLRLMVIAKSSQSGRSP